jgi:glycolate oxidase FAD binding subunit
MKNVAGFDVSRLLCGSLGILGLITQVSLKVLPRPADETTLSFEEDAAAALDRFNRLRAQPLPISATAWSGGVSQLRLSGSASALRAARMALGGETVDAADAAASWRGLRDQTDPFFAGSASLWRLSVPATAPLEGLGADLIEWSGALRWLRSEAPATEIRGIAERIGGTAMRWRGRRDATMFHPLTPASLELHRRVKRQFDPNGIFNRGRLIREL